MSTPPSVVPSENVGAWRGKDVLGADGDKLGKLQDHYYDGESDEPAFAAVRSGTIGKRITLVPLRGASVGPEHLRVGYDKDQFRKAPSFGTDVELSMDDEAEAFRYFGMDYQPTAQGGRRLALR
jgi:hypothetical protein